MNLLPIDGTTLLEFPVTFLAVISEKCVQRKYATFHQQMAWLPWPRVAKRLSPFADFESVRYLTWLSRLLSRRRTAVASARRPTAWIRSQLLLLAKLLDRWLLPADDTPELELVVDVGDVEPRPGSVLANAVLFIDCFPIQKKKWKEIVTHTSSHVGTLRIWKKSFPFS